ncbi:MAG TPA: cupin domain-containing protein, partial [Beijerinckiaceae bacterium]|nr:cupin domain-containing protein [Beijerinckiaceae bacterium]
KAVVLMDGPAPNQKLRRVGNVVSTLLWATDETPADASGRLDRSDREAGVAPPAMGSVFRVVEFPPAHEAGVLDNAAMLAEMGLGPDAGNARHASMHRTRSVDYAIILEGEIDMALDDSQVHLKAGDAVVQQATNHAWVNNGERSCRIAFVLIDAQPPRQWTD